MKKTLLGFAAPLVAAIAVTTLPTTASAQLSFNVGGVSDYRYRGISQTRLKPALQAGADWSHESGFYLGTWGSTIKWIKDWNGDADVEVDLYGGYKGAIVKDVANFDVGVLQYWYPGARTSDWDAGFKNPNTTELYGAVSGGPLTFKLSYALTNLFGNYDFANGRDTKGSWYADLAASFDVGYGVIVAPHVGHQKVKDMDVASYTDWSISVSKDFNGLVPSLTVVGTDADKVFYAPGPAANSTKFLGKTAVVVGLKYTF